jgi:hypothetical protein
MPELVDRRLVLLAADDDNEEDDYENDIVEEDGADVLILENSDEHVIKRQLCEEEKRKLIADGHAWTVGQITWTAVANSVPDDPIPKYPTCGIRGFDFEIFSKLKKDMKEFLSLETLFTATPGLLQ